jgi:hypothetical protein
MLYVEDGDIVSGSTQDHFAFYFDPVGVASPEKGKQRWTYLGRRQARWYTQAGNPAMVHHTFHAA